MLVSLSLLLIPACGRAAWIDVSEGGSAAVALATITKHMAITQLIWAGTQ